MRLFTIDRLFFLGVTFTAAAIWAFALAALAVWPVWIATLWALAWAFIFHLRLLYRRLSALNTLFAFFHR